MAVPASLSPYRSLSLGPPLFTSELFSPTAIRGRSGAASTFAAVELPEDRTIHGAMRCSIPSLTISVWNRTAPKCPRMIRKNR